LERITLFDKALQNLSDKFIYVRIDRNIDEEIYLILEAALKEYKINMEKEFK
jgi:hypothetical protein